MLAKALSLNVMGKASKATKKFASSGKLKKTIQARHKQQQIRKKVQNRRNNKNGKTEPRPDSDGLSDNEGGQVEIPGKKSGKKMTVDDILGGGFMDASDKDENEELEGDDDAEDSGDEAELSFDDNESFASVDDLDDDGQKHLLELSKLAEKDPEFYKYLQENDHELLEFNPDGAQEDFNSDVEMDESDGDIAIEDQQPKLTKEHITKWQKALLEQQSLRALRKLLIAFRAAAHMNEDGQVLAWTIDSPSVYNKLVLTTLKYTPVVLEHHVPCKTLANGKFKAPTQTKKFRILQKLILSYFHNIMHILSQLTNSDLLRIALAESAKIIPYVMSSRKTIKLYLKKCLDLWSSADDSTRIAAFLSIRKLSLAHDQAILDVILKNTYLALIRSAKTTNAHILPTVNLMKNTASELYCYDHAIAYQHAFGYIRQLAIHLRNSIKVKTKESFKQVYNWQFVHSIDFWCIVLARACDSEVENGISSELRPLIYPLVQVSLGSIKLITNNRSYPFHLHIIRSLLHLTKHSRTYVPLSPYLVSMLATFLTPSTRPKSSTLRPLDLEVTIRVPQQYMKTRIYSEVVAEEAAFLLAEWLASPTVHGSIAFPEIVVPITVSLRKGIKQAKSGTNKEYTVIKGLLDRIEESAKWVEQQRVGVVFTPQQSENVKTWEESLMAKLDEASLPKYVKVMIKARDKRRKLVQKAREGEDEILEE